MKTRAKSTPKHAPMNEFERGSSDERWVGDGVGRVAPKNASGAPVDLLQFIRGRSFRQAANALHLSLGMVHKICNGYWPANSAKIMAAWDRYKSKQQASRGPSIKAIRRVHAGGVVHYRGRQYTHPQLAALTGTVPLCRAPEGQLQAVLIGEVTTYLPLQPVED